MPLKVTTQGFDRDYRNPNTTMDFVSLLPPPKVASHVIFIWNPQITLFV